MIARAVRAARGLPRVETAAVALAVAVLVALAVLKSPAPPPYVDTFSSFDGGAGGYLALYEMLAREGLPVTRFQKRALFLNASVGTLFRAEPLDFDDARQRTAAVDDAALVAWVRGGGRLLYVVDGGLTTVAALRVPAAAPIGRRSHRPFVAAELRAAGVRAVDPLRQERWRVPKGAFTVLLDDGRGPLVVRYRLGRGSVTAVADERLFTNARIAHGDAARLALALVTSQRSNAAVAFDEALHGYVVSPHWWSIVPRPFVAALALALAVLVVAFAGAAFRLGPPIVPRPRDARSTADFIGGLASLLQRGRAVRGALADLLASTSHAAARAFAVPAGASHDELAARIEPAELRTAYRELVALVSNDRAVEAQLVRGAALAQRLRKEFAPHGPE